MRIETKEMPQIHKLMAICSLHYLYRGLMFDLQCYSSSQIFIKYSGAYDTSNHPTLLIQVQVSEVLQLQPGVRQQMPRHIFVNTNNEDIEPDSLDPNINNGDDPVIVGAPSKEEQPPPLPSHSELKSKTKQKNVIFLRPKKYCLG